VQEFYLNSQIAILANKCHDVNTKKYFVVNYNLLTPDDKAFPPQLLTIPSSPKQLFVTCKSAVILKKLLTLPAIAVVGSRNISPYGHQVTRTLVQQLSEQGIVIVSGLALGVDAIAHKAALDSGGPTIAVLPSSLDIIVPASNAQLAAEIINNGGALFSEYASGVPALKQNYIARNRLVAGLASAVLITEAGEKSGSLHTAKFASAQGKNILVVPGPITSPNSAGTNSLIKQGATAITGFEDVLQVLGLHARTVQQADLRGETAEQQLLIDLLQQGPNDSESLLKQSCLSVSDFNQTITALELSGKIQMLGVNSWAIR
jgi:DNA processing protein